MTKKTRKKRTYSKIIVTIGLILIISLAIFALYSIANLVIEPSDIVVVNNGEVYSEESSVGYVIREETLIDEKTDKQISQIKTEGEKIAKGEALFKYNTQEEKELQTNIEELTVQIQEALEGQTNLFSSDIKALENQIENKLYGIEKKNNIQNIKEYKHDVSTYITKKAKIAGELSESGSYINSLIEQKENLEEQMYLNAEYVYAPESGIVSYRVDDLENQFRTDDFSYVTTDFLNNLNLKTGQVVNTSSNKSKIVNNYKCYIATILESEEAENIKENKTVTLRLFNQAEVNAKVVYKNKEEKNRIIVVFEINDKVKELIEYRKISIDVIWWKVEGLKVPKNAIYYNEGLAYVERNRAGYLDKILVKIIEENEDYCIVNSYETEELKKLGFSTEDINSYKRINLYDELLVNPQIK